MMSSSETTKTSESFARRTEFVIVLVSTVALGSAAVLRGGHSPGHDELNFLETGLRMLGSHGDPKEFLHGSFVYDVMAFVQGMTYLARGVLGESWQPERHIEFYLANRDGFLLFGRLLVVISAVALIVMVGRVARLLYNESAGILAMAFSVFGAILVLTGTQLKEDVPASVFGLLSVYLLIRETSAPSAVARWTLSGFLLGIAVATKYTMAPLVIVPLAIALYNRSQVSRRQSVALLAGVVAGFVIAEPFLLLDFPKSIWSALPQVELLRENHPFIATRYLQDFIPLGMGIPLLLCAVPAVIKAILGEDARKKAIGIYIVAGAAITLSATYGVPRYMMPWLPFVWIIAAGEMARLEFVRMRGSLVLVAIALVLTWPANLIGLKYLLLLSRADNRAMAQTWIESRIPPKSKLLVEGAVNNTEPSFAPALVPSAEWYQIKEHESQRAGSTGMIFRAASAVADRSQRPRYDLALVGNVAEVTSFDAYDHVVLSAYDSLPGEWYFLVEGSEPDVQRAVVRREEALRRLDAAFDMVLDLKPAPNLRFDWITNNPDYWRIWAADLTAFKTWVVGPRIQIYRRKMQQIASSG